MIVITGHGEAPLAVRAMKAGAVDFIDRRIPVDRDPGRTKRLPVAGGPLALLAGLRLFGRLACLVSALFPLWLAIATALSFPVALFVLAYGPMLVHRRAT